MKKIFFMKSGTVNNRYKWLRLALIYWGVCAIVVRVGPPPITLRSHSREHLVADAPARGGGVDVDRGARMDPGVGAGAARPGAHRE